MIEIGAPATIHLYTDTLAAVVTRVTATRVFVRRVATGVEVTSNAAEVALGGLPIRVSKGILTEPTGPEEGYKIRENGRHGKLGRGEIVVTIGKSISKTDYRF